MPWLRRRSTSCGDCGLSRAIRQTILLVPMSSAATIAERRGDTGFIFGVKPSRRLMRRLPSSWLLGLERFDARAAAASSDSRTVTRSGSRRSTTAMSRRQQLLVAVELHQRVERLLDVGLPAAARRCRSSARRSSAARRPAPPRASGSRISGYLSSSARNSLALVSAPTPTTSGSLAKRGADVTARPRCRRRRSPRPCRPSARARRPRARSPRYAAGPDRA